MGGKNKTTQPQRTKNNARPSSSGRSAELLSNNTGTSLVGFSAIPTDSLASMLSKATSSDNPNEEFDSNIDPNIQIILRKMKKKDVITKIKALQEFLDFILKLDPDTIKTLLSYWSQMYCKLAIDVDHRVRENAQQVHTTIASKSGKNIAPYLRQIAPIWIISQYDVYAPAASIALTSFNNSFPPHKLKEFFKYCQNEILGYVIKNLTVLTATTLSNPNTYSSAECDMIYERIVSSCLRGYSLFLVQIPENEIKDASQKHLTLINNPKFWNFHKNVSVNIRAAWFETLSTLLQYCKFLIEQHETEVVKYTIHHIDETDLIVIPNVWSSFIIAIDKIINWYNLINIEKAFLPKLWKILKTGGNNNSIVIYPHLLPLLSICQREFLIKNNNIEKFYVDFFDNIKIGLQFICNKKQSRSNIIAIATAYFECLQFLLSQILTNVTIIESVGNVDTFYMKLISVHVFDVIRWYLENNQNYFKYVFTRINSLIKYISENKNYILCEQLLNKFWMELFLIFENSLNGCENVNEIVDMQVDIVYHLKANKSKTTKVTFSQVEAVDEDQKKTNPNNCSHNSINEFELNELGLKLCNLYIKQVTKTNKKVYILNLEKLLRIFDSKEFLMKLSGNETITSLYDKFAVWLLISDELRIENCIDIILCMYKHLESVEKYNLLEKLIKFPNEKVRYWVLNRLLSSPLRFDPETIRLLATNHVSDLLIKCANNIINNDEQENLNILHKSFFLNDNSEIVINRETCGTIVDTILNKLDEIDSIDLHICASFLAQIMPVICSDKNLEVLSSNMFVKFFEYNLKHLECIQLPGDTLWEIETAWQDVLSCDDLILNDSLLEICVEFINKKIATDISMDVIDKISNIIWKLILCSITHTEDDTKVEYNKIDKMLTSIFRINDKIKNSLENICIFMRSINGVATLESHNYDNEKEFDIDENNIHILIKTTIIAFNVLYKLTHKEDDENNDRPSRDTADSDLYKIMTTGNSFKNESYLLNEWSLKIQTTIVHCINIGSLGNLLIEYCPNINKSLEQNCLLLSNKIGMFLEKITDEKQTQIMDSIILHFTKDGLKWLSTILSLKCINKYRNKDNNLLSLFMDATKDSIENGNIRNYLNLLQLMEPNLSKRSLPTVLNYWNSELLFDIVYKQLLLKNYFTLTFNNREDILIIASTINLLNSLFMTNIADKTFLLQNGDLQNISFREIERNIAVANFFREIVEKIPYEIDVPRWDFIRLKLSAWVLIIVKSLNIIKKPQNELFVVAVFKLFVSVSKFMTIEITPYVPKNFKAVFEEWEQLFSEEINLLVIKCYMKFVIDLENTLPNYSFLDVISTNMQYVRFNHVLRTGKVCPDTNIEDLIKFALKHLTHEIHNVRWVCSFILKELSIGLIRKDMEIIHQNTSEHETKTKWHLLHKFQNTIELHHSHINEYIQDFSFKPTELEDEANELIPSKIAMTYLLLWDCILHVCEKAPSELRSVYVLFITQNNYEQIVFKTIFRLLPTELLKYSDVKLAIGQSLFTPFTAKQLLASSIQKPDQYACHIYTKMLRVLPAVARKYWHNLNTRQKNIIDKITTNFVAEQICHLEFQELNAKRGKDKNIEIQLRPTIREINATYTIEDACMELIVTLPINYPLGSIKIDLGQHIGSRFHSRDLIMQLSIFLTHQNGSIWDALMLWKKNLDRKFEGVEECFICYSVIHQDSCQLPKQSCRNCKKKFHGPCLYKWFSTSNKSTCPICRSIF